MQILTVGNLVAQVLQVALLVAVTATTLTLLRVRNPRVRYAAWRSLLFLVAVVPFVQPWHVTTTIVPATHAFLQGSVAPAAEPSVFDAATAWGRSHLVPLAIVAGCALRLLWILVGVLRLRRRLRKDGRECGAAAPIQAELHTPAAVYYLEGIQQPATCGWLRPVVLLPAHVETQEAALIRAVLVHELLHVKRGDWPVLVGEELVRAMHWFNPVMWWLVDRIQFAREEVVDAAAIPLVGGRRTYVRALLTFADAPPVALAPAFARRRHLFTRITRLSEESTMSTRRAAFTALMLVVCAAAASAAAITTFPISGGEEFLVALQPEPATGQAQDPPPPPPPAPVPVEARRKAGPKKPPPPPPPVPRDVRYLTVESREYVFVRGEIKAPVVWKFEEGLTVAAAIAKAGGVSSGASAPERATITRTGADGKRVTFGAQSSDVLQRGDVLFVPRKPY